MSDEEVATTLRESHAAHQAAFLARQQKDPVTAKTHLETAYRRRLEAHDLDPAHTAPAWQAEQAKTAVGRDTHTELLGFYRQQLGVTE